MYLLRVRQFGFEAALLADQLRVLRAELLHAREQLVDLRAKLLLGAARASRLDRIGALAAHIG